MNNIILKINNETIYKNITIRQGDLIDFMVELDGQVNNIIYACAGNLYGDEYAFIKTLGDGIIDLGDGKYQVIVDSVDTNKLIVGTYKHNLRVEIENKKETILDGLFFVESNIGYIDYIYKKPNELNYNSFIDGTIKEAYLMFTDQIRVGLFAGCELLEKVYFSSNLKKIMSSAFEGCTSLALTSLPDKLEDIESLAFSGCTNLAFLLFPESLKTIGIQSFLNCTNLQSLRFKGTPLSITGNAFQGCINLRDIYVPWSEGQVLNAPWGATNATIHYNS